jgi:hypothetical protein
MRLFYACSIRSFTAQPRDRTLLAPLGISADQREGHHTEEEARTILAESLAGGRASEVRRRLVERALEFANKRARQFMDPARRHRLPRRRAPAAREPGNRARARLHALPAGRGSIDEVVRHRPHQGLAAARAA